MGHFLLVEGKNLPLYEYECEKCGERFEIIQKVDAKSTHKCPKCPGQGKRLLSAPAIRFRGTGWYVTDYGTGKKMAKERDKEEKPPKKKEAASKETSKKTDSKKKN